jgi:hypothetical protein
MVKGKEVCIWPFNQLRCNDLQKIIVKEKKRAARCEPPFLEARRCTTSDYGR